MKAILLSLAFAIGIGAQAQSPDHAKRTAAEKAERRTDEVPIVAGTVSAASPCLSTSASLGLLRGRQAPIEKRVSA